MPVVFDYPTWAARYPTLGAQVGSDLAQLYFNEAELYCDNTDTSPIADLTQRAMLLNMVVAHIAQLTITGQVGRVTSASEGSVSTSLEYIFPGGASWFAQTQYGIAFWEATKQYRTFQFYQGYPRSFEPYPYSTLWPM